MKKSDIAAHVARQASVPKATAKSAVNAVFDAVGDALARGETVTLRGFGTFAAKSREARTGRNPRTGENGAVAASRAPSFKAGKPLRDRLRKGQGPV